MCQLGTGIWQQLCPGADGSYWGGERWWAERSGAALGALREQEPGEGKVDPGQLELLCGSEEEVAVPGKKRVCADSKM